MANAKYNIPTLMRGNKIYPENLVVLGEPLSTGRVWYVDGDVSSGGAGGSGRGSGR